MRVFYGAVAALLAAGAVCLAAGAAPAVVPLERAHSHNDYSRPRPLLDALDAGFCSVEADIFLVDGELLVAHPRQASGALADGLREPGAHWLWGTMRCFLPYYRSALLAALLSNALMLVTGIVTSVVYDKVIPHQAMTTR